MSVTRSSARKLLRALLAPHGFAADGNYFGRQVGDAWQALYLQPSTGAHCYYPEMLIAYSSLGPGRRNSQSDCHLRARLSRFYHPEGDPRQRPRQEWTIRYDCPDVSADMLEEQLADAIPTHAVAADKMKVWSHAFCVSRQNLFQDLGMAVPVPVGFHDSSSPQPPGGPV